MKKLSFLFSLFVLLTAFTCEDEPLEGEFINEDFDLQDFNPLLVGTWTLIEFDVDLTSITSFEGQDFVLDFTSEMVSSDYTLVFTETVYTVSGDYVLESTTTVNGEVNDSYLDEYNGVSGEGTYVTNGNVMTIDGSFLDFEVDGMQTGDLDINQDADFQLSADGQTLTFFQDSEQLNEDNGFDTNTMIEATSVWQRVE
ncbi:hypothetical protein [uncultured Psychroserpens sp.]|uniref:hypothetical protein n=1 Tax=uncultured Psychroserpens sp. TaxID=255436 RepID=UPI0026141556|nr:hypothetical protein [uncultured Psychroserpens sp.]